MTKTTPEQNKALVIDAFDTLFNKQFRAAGHEEDARELSVHLFCAFQGMAAVSHAANDPDLVVMEVKRLKERPNDRATGAIDRKEQHDESSA